LETNKVIYKQKVAARVHLK